VKESKPWGFELQPDSLDVGGQKSFGVKKYRTPLWCNIAERCPVFCSSLS